MSPMASQITSLGIVYSTVYSGADQRKHQSSASLAFVRRIHRGPVNSPHKRPVTRKMFPFDDVIMNFTMVNIVTIVPSTVNDIHIYWWHDTSKQWLYTKTNSASLYNVHIWQRPHTQRRHMSLYAPASTFSTLQTHHDSHAPWLHGIKQGFTNGHGWGEISTIIANDDLVLRSIHIPKLWYLTR